MTKNIWYHGALVAIGSVIGIVAYRLDNYIVAFCGGIVGGILSVGLTRLEEKEKKHENKNLRATHLP